MRKTIVSAAVLALFVVGAPVALAQEDAPSCAEAQLAFTRAQVALDAALAADKAAADAKAADEALAAAERALEDAREAALSGGVPLANQTAGDATRLRAELAELLAIPVEERTTENQERIDEIEDRLPLIDAVVQAETRLAAARVAAEADADRLADVANQTDAEALSAEREEAREAADEACGGVVTTPPPAPPVFEDLDCDQVTDARAQELLDADPNDPHRFDEDNDGIACEVGDPASERDPISSGGSYGGVVTPSGGVATGGGPA